MRTTDSEKLQNEAESIRENICGCEISAKQKRAHRCAICGRDDARREFMDKYICENCRSYIAENF